MSGSEFKAKQVRIFKLSSTVILLCAFSVFLGIFCLTQNEFVGNFTPNVPLAKRKSDVMTQTNKSEWRNIWSFLRGQKPMFLNDFLKRKFHLFFTPFFSEHVYAVWFLQGSRSSHSILRPGALCYWHFQTRRFQFIWKDTILKISENALLSITVCSISVNGLSPHGP